MKINAAAATAASMTTHAREGVDRDPEVLRSLAAEPEVFGGRPERVAIDSLETGLICDLYPDRDSKLPFYNIDSEWGYGFGIDE